MLAMTRRPLSRIVIAAALVLLAVQGVDAASAYSQGIYRGSAFSTQATGYLCTAAVVQNVVNLATGQSSRSETQQRVYYAYGRAHNRYAYRSRGVDPQGVEAMLEHYIPGSDWRQIRKKSLQAVLRVAARQMRATSLPPVLFVAGGRHVWTMNGYSATADPAAVSWFTVTYVTFSGPNYPRQIARYGWFDLEPNTRRGVSRLATAYFPYRESLAFGDRRSTPWNGYYVAVVPWTIDDGGEEPPPTPNPTPDPSLEPVPTATPGASSPTTVEGAPEPTPPATSEPAPLVPPEPSPESTSTAS
jgi:hypothetical protein